ncbi:MAG: YraN family protein [Candidatus Omnitrophica bacterium]|nr:YraN family protein [Candidatus Omnitrophota bacterium]MBU4488136.1 YraN family protein [Candidatus Omnitrophota bacterium]
MMSLLKHLMINWWRVKDNIGKTGEALASGYLKRQGYEILERNYKTKIGEIDIVARDGKALVFVEVKTRQSDLYGLPEEAINAKKMRKLTQLAELYIKRKHLYQTEARFDVVGILMDCGNGSKSIRLTKNAF